MAGKMTRLGLENAAARLDCDVPALKAVLKVETAGRGFFADGRPVILFERHVFSRLTDHAFDALHPDVSNTTAGGYLGMEREYGRLYKAAQLDADAAVASCSWGIGQIMGFNWDKCGEKSLTGFLLAMHNHEDVQLQLMAQFIIEMRAALPLRNHSWTEFAAIYNGKGYARNDYHTKLAKAYDAAKLMETA